MSASLVSATWSRRPLRKGLVLLYALVPGLVFLDLVNGFLKGGADSTGVSVGQIVRGLITLWAGVTVIRVSSPTFRGLQKRFLALLGFGIIGPVLAMWHGVQASELLFDLMTLSKALFGPGLILLLALAVVRSRLTVTEVLGAVALTGAIAGASIVILNILGLGQATYLWQGVGFKGFFISQNEVGLTMGLSLFASLELLVLERRPRYFVATVLTVSGMVLLGTRAASLGTILIPVAVMAVNWGRPSPGLPALRPSLVALLLVLLLAAGLWGYHRIKEQRFLQSKFASLTESRVILVRGVLLISALQYVAHRDLTRDLVGEGATDYERGVARSLGGRTVLKAAEVDWLDLYGSFGLFFVVAIYGFYVGFVRRLRAIGRHHGRPVQLVALMMLGWLLAHSVVAGHALGSAMPTSALAPVLAYAWVLAQRPQVLELPTPVAARLQPDVD